MSIELTRTKRVVILGPIGPLLLTDLRLNERAEVISGFVINGGWRFKITAEKFEFWDGRKLIAAYPRKPYRVCYVPDNLDGDCNEIIAWAEKETDMKK